MNDIYDGNVDSFMWIKVYDILLARLLIWYFGCEVCGRFVIEKGFMLIVCDICACYHFGNMFIYEVSELHDSDVKFFNL